MDGGHVSDDLVAALHTYCQSTCCIEGERAAFSFLSAPARSALAMARPKRAAVAIRLVSMAGTGYFYTKRKNIKANPEKCARLRPLPTAHLRSHGRPHPSAG